MGDPSMKLLPPMDHVIDFAHSAFKTPKADILIAACCRFFLGTNSGFATIPNIFGVKCVFSNWLPVGLPLWSSQDLLYPKLYWSSISNRYLTFEEIFSSDIAFIQNWSDLPEGISLRDNTANEIYELTAEALEIEFNNDSQDILVGARKAYDEIARKNGSYMGSTLSAAFIRRYKALLGTD